MINTIGHSSAGSCRKGKRHLQLDWRAPARRKGNATLGFLFAGGGFRKKIESQREEDGRNV